MTEAEWLTCGAPHQMLNQVQTSVSVRKLRLFTVAVYQAMFPPFYTTDAGIGADYADGLAAEDVFLAAIGPSGGWSPNLRCLVEPTGGVYSIVDHVYDDMSEQISTWGTYRGSSEPFLRKCAEDISQIARDIFGNPFRPVTFDPSWRTPTVTALARGMYESRDFSAMPILADALQDAGCDNEDVLDHCRGPGPHVRGCWVVDLVLGKD